ncbi:MAG: M1 family metallopeptidase [Chloroflexi bacterium]|nr:M1 family metallopeptidase [Chloroflexota bacterium]
MVAVDSRDFRLTKAVRPRRYQISLDLDLQTWTSSGRETIELVLDEPSREIVLHALDLDIKTARIDSDISMEQVAYRGESQTATIRFDQEIPRGAHSLEIEWVAEIREALRGLYRSTHGGARFAATQFEATDARRAFPCFDEPEFKAHFALELTYDAGLTAIANGTIESTEPAEDGRVRTRFAETPPISTYLVAFTVGPYESTAEARTPTGLPVRIWLPAGLAHQGGYALDAHVRSVHWLENYTGIPYPYGKLDGIGLPDFEAGAMENPGAITYRTTLLAADPATASTAAYKRIHSVVSHELTHMWWGDLVTMAWWDDLWLNESFASHVGEKATDALNPEWGYRRDIVSQATAAFNLDQLASTHAIHMEVRNADQASERFDAVTYQKGMAVLRMIESFIGEKPFQDGVHIYLTRHAESNATADDFWRALDESSQRDVSRIANAWIREPGHPLVTLSLSQGERLAAGAEAPSTGEGGALELELSQTRFFADPAVPATDQRWLVPLVLKYGTAGGPREERILFEGDRATVRLPGAQWVYPNAGGRGFYRYAMDDAAVTALATHVGELEPEERLMLIDNQWALTRADRASLPQLFALIAGMRGETDRAVLSSISDAFAWLSTHAVPDDQRPWFEQFVAAVFDPVLAELGWEVRPTDTMEEKEKRALALGVLGRTAALPSVRAEARIKIIGHLDGSRPLDPDIASALAGVAAARGDEALYERYVQRMKQTADTDPQEEARFRNALVAFEEPGLVKRTAEASFGELIRTQDRGLMLFGLLGGRHSRRIAWPIVQEHWETGVETLDRGGKHRIISAVGQLTPHDLEAEAAAWLKAKQSPDSVETTAQTLERLRLGADAAERLAEQIGEALTRAGGEP